jgi:hypothetical protein
VAAEAEAKASVKKATEVEREEKETTKKAVA